MAQLFRASELVELAIAIERNGEEFYTSLKESAQGEKAREVFDWLAAEEKKHIEVFQALLEPLKKHEPVETYPGEYEGYMKEVADSHVFIKKDAGKRLAKGFGSSLEGITMAVRFEKDTILFFQAMRQFIPDAQWETVDELTNEERKHIVKLKELRDTVG